MILPEQGLPGGEARGIREVAVEALLAIQTLTAWQFVPRHIHLNAERKARAMLMLPIPALILGVILALIDHTLAGISISLRSATVILISIIACGALYPVGFAHGIGELRSGSRPSWTGLTEVGPAGVLAAAALVVLEVCLLASIANSPARAQALVLAMMLSRWAIVPVAYGLKPLERRGLGVSWEGGIKFREFAGSSVIALAIAMGLYQVVAIAVIVVLAITILILRLLFSRRIGGVSGFSLAAGAAACELVVFAVLAAIPL